MEVDDGRIVVVAVAFSRPSRSRLRFSDEPPNHRSASRAPFQAKQTTIKRPRTKRNARTKRNPYRNCSTPKSTEAFCVLNTCFDNHVTAVNYTTCFKFYFFEVILKAIILKILKFISKYLKKNQKRDEIKKKIKFYTELLQF